MSDYVKLSLTMREADIEKFSHAIEDCSKWWDEKEEETPGVAVLHVDAKYGWIDECARAAQAGCVFTARHERGESFDGAEYAAFDSVFDEMPCDYDGNLVIPVPDRAWDETEADVVKTLRDFMTLRRKATEYIFAAEPANNPASVLKPDPELALRVAQALYDDTESWGHTYNDEEDQLGTQIAYLLYALLSGHVYEYTEDDRLPWLLREAMLWGDVEPYTRRVS